HATLVRCLGNVDIVNLKQTSGISQYSNIELIDKFISAKEIEGCSKRTTKYYESTLLKMNSKLDKEITHMTTDDLRTYLTDYQKINNCSKASVDNIRRNLSSFFSWLEEENYILKSPMKRIHKIKTDKVIKETYSDETLELLRDNCNNLRDLAIIDILASTGMRVGELVKLNINDIDFENRECVVFGKGNKERPVYFDARTKIHLKNYLNSRTDGNPALFVSLDSPYDRLKISGVEIRLRQLGRRLGIQKVHPHKFRRTVATKAIDKGMPIEQVQSLLGHSQIDTTMHYAMVNQNNVKESHRKYVA
ncbi:MAG: tyrosine-type recombinase/integrase, partial [Erysipelotrichaceae bacterium]|nr:tyrosine-type recombinase/integrase [Erysipelotrichaceae bacterium]